MCRQRSNGRQSESDDPEDPEVEDHESDLSEEVAHVECEGNGYPELVLLEYLLKQAKLRELFNVVHNENLSLEDRKQAVHTFLDSITSENVVLSPPVPQLLTAPENLVVETSENVVLSPPVPQLLTAPENPVVETSENVVLSTPVPQLLTAPENPVVETSENVVLSPPVPQLLTAPENPVVEQISEVVERLAGPSVPPEPENMTVESDVTKCVAESEQHETLPLAASSSRGAPQIAVKLDATNVGVPVEEPEPFMYQE